MTSRSPHSKQMEEVLLDGMDDNNISSILLRWNAIKEQRQVHERVEEILRQKATVFLKEHKWTFFKDEQTKLKISLLRMARRSVDFDLLKEYLNDAKYAQVVRTITFEQVRLEHPIRVGGKKK